MKNIRAYQGYGDNGALLKLDVKKPTPRKIAVCVGRDGEPYVIALPVSLKAVYSEADRALADRLAAEAPVYDGEYINLKAEAYENCYGEKVVVNGGVYKVRVKGDYADPAELIKVEGV